MSIGKAACSSNARTQLRPRSRSIAAAVLHGCRSQRSRHDRQLRALRPEGPVLDDARGPGPAHRRGQPAGAGLWNGDTPDTIKDGFEYCMAANIANRAGAGQGGYGQRRLGRAGRRPDQNYDLAPLAGHDHRRAQEGGRLLGALLLLRHRRAGEEGHRARRGLDQDRSSAQQANRRDLRRREAEAETPAKVFPDTTSMFTALMANQIDVAMTDTAIVLSQAAGLERPVRGGRPVRHRRDLWRHLPQGLANAALDQVIQALIDDGTVKKLAGEVPRRRLGRRSDRDPLLPAVIGRGRGRRCAGGRRRSRRRRPGRPSRRWRSRWAWRRRRSGRDGGAAAMAAGGIGSTLADRPPLASPRPLLHPRRG